MLHPPSCSWLRQIGSAGSVQIAGNCASPLGVTKLSTPATARASSPGNWLKGMAAWCVQYNGRLGNCAASC
ncbi:hypothetical protein D3C85_1719650 [compost metagenome]